MLYKIITFS